MKKKVLLILTIFLLAFSLSACSDEGITFETESFTPKGVRLAGSRFGQPIGRSWSSPQTTSKFTLTMRKTRRNSMIFLFLKAVFWRWFLKVIQSGRTISAWTNPLTRANHRSNPRCRSFHTGSVHHTKGYIPARTDYDGSADPVHEWRRHYTHCHQ